MTTERTKEPTKRIIRVGTYDPAPSVEPKQVELPYTTKIVYDKNLEPGQEVVDQEGENGIIEVTVKDGQPEVKTVKEPVEKIVRVGTKPAEGVEWTEEIAFEVKVVEDPELEAGKVETVQQGKPGERVHKTDGTEEVRVKPVDHIIKVGTKCNCETPTEEPTPDPTDDPTEGPTDEPTPGPSEDPSEEPSQDPSEDPSQDPSEEPSQDPSEEPSQDPSEEPSKDPSDKPNEPGDDPSQPSKPGDKPSNPTKPGDKPSQPSKPGDKPSEGTQAPGASGGNDTGGDGSKPADSSGSGSSPLPRTGVSVAATLAAAAVLIAGGVGLLAVRRRPSKR